MTFTGVAPGHGSLRALAWLARVGAAPAPALELVMGCSERVARDHVLRLETAGLVRRTPMRRGDGVLVVITRDGALEAGRAGTHALRSVGPTSWAHVTACAWVSAWLELRGRDWIGEREVLHDDSWRYELSYHDHRGTVRVTHRPDLGVLTAAGPVAIEVELQRKGARRLRGICAMYAQLIDNPDEPLAGVIYITDRNDVSGLLERAAQDVGLTAPALSLRALHDVVEQTHTAASTRPATHTNGASR
jgi:hypothetical protein